MRLVSVAALVAAIVGQSAAPAFAQQGAQQPSCTCQVSRSEVGRFSDVGGDVAVLGAAGLTGARPGQSVAVGSRVISGSDGAGQISFGQTCVINIEPETSYDVGVEGQKVCVRTSRNVFTPQQAGATGGSLAPAGIAAGALVLGGVGAGIAVSSKSKNPGNFPPLSF